MVVLMLLMLATLVHVCFNGVNVWQNPNDISSLAQRCDPPTLSNIYYYISIHFKIYF